MYVLNYSEPLDYCYRKLLDGFKTLTLLFTNILVQGDLDCLEKRLHEFHYSSHEIEEILNLVHLCVIQKKPLFSMVFFIPKLKAWE